MPPGFRAFELRFDDLEISAASAALRVLTRQQGSGTFDTGASDYSGSSCGSSAGSAAFQVIAGGAFQSAITCNHAFVLTNDAPARCAGVIRLHNPRDASTYTPVTGHIFYNRTGGSNHATFGWNRAAAHDVDAFRVLLSTGNIVTMNWTLYGVRAS